MRIPEGLTQEQIQAEVQAAAAEGRTPFDGQGGAEDAPDGEPQAFTWEDLAADYTLRRVPYSLPGTGKRLWVGATSDEDAEQAVEMGLKAAGENASPTARLRAIRAFQAIRCCWQGPAIGEDGRPTRAKRCFRASDYQAIRQRLGHGVVEEIVSLSERLSGSEESLGAGVAAFFRHTQGALRILSSRCETWDGFPPGWKATLTALESLVSRALTRGALDSGILDELERVRWPEG